MPSTALHTSATDFRKVLATNSTTAAFVARTDVLTLPTVGLVDLRASEFSDFTPNTVLLKFFGVGADNTTGSCRVYGLRPVRDAGNVVTSYTHVLLAQYAFTLSADVGVSGGVVTNSERYADTIARSSTTGIENVADQLLSPTGDVSGHVLLDCKGHSLLFVEPITGGSATSVNALFAGV